MLQKSFFATFAILVLLQSNVDAQLFRRSARQSNRCQCSQKAVVPQNNASYANSSNSWNTVNQQSPVADQNVAYAPAVPLQVVPSNYQVLQQQPVFAAQEASMGYQQTPTAEQNVAYPTEFSQPVAIEPSVVEPQFIPQVVEPHHQVFHPQPVFPVQEYGVSQMPLYSQPAQPELTGLPVTTPTLTASPATEFQTNGSTPVIMDSTATNLPVNSQAIGTTTAQPLIGNAPTAESVLNDNSGYGTSVIETHTVAPTTPNEAAPAALPASGSDASILDVAK